MNLTNATGFLVVDIIAGGPADEAGLRGGYVLSNVNGTELELGGDTILKIDNKTVNSIDEILSYLDTKKVGDTVRLTILRGGEVESIPVQLGPSSASFAESPLSPNAVQPKLPLQPPDNNSNQEQQQPQSDPSDSLLNDLNDRCAGILGKSLCDQLFDR